MDSAAVQARTAEVQEALAKLNELQEKEEKAEVARETRWQGERDKIEMKHREVRALLTGKRAGRRIGVTLQP